MTISQCHSVIACVIAHSQQSQTLHYFYDSLFMVTLHGHTRPIIYDLYISSSTSHQRTSSSFAEHETKESS